MASSGNVPVSSSPKRIGMVVGEASGDILGAGLMVALKKIYPNAVFEGVGGPRMLAEGFDSLHPQETLAVMGLIEPLKRLPSLLRIRRQLIQHFIETKPDVVVGIDSPDFNLDLELAVRAAGIRTVHYVSPSVWAWRQKRVLKIEKAVDLMLTLFPFEAEFYQAHQVPVKFVGHPLADTIAFSNDKHQARVDLSLAGACMNKQVVALLPGSRHSEVKQLMSLFADIVRFASQIKDNLLFLIPSANEKRHQEIQAMLERFELGDTVELIHGQSHKVMAAADVIIMASGTTTLEAMLIKRPMIITYKLATLSYWILKRLVKVKNVGLPNLLIGETVVPEFIQEEAQAEPITRELLTLLDNEFEAREQTNRFAEQHIRLRRQASEKAAEAIAKLIEGPK